MAKELRKLRDDPVPLVQYGRKQWSLTAEGFRQLGVEPVAARYPFRPRRMPAREKRKRNTLVRADVLKTLDTPIIE